MRAVVLWQICAQSTNEIGRKCVGMPNKKRLSKEKKVIGGWNSWPNASKPKASTKCENGEPSCAKKMRDNSTASSGLCAMAYKKCAMLCNKPIDTTSIPWLDSMKASKLPCRKPDSWENELIASRRHSRERTKHRETSENSDSAPFWRTWDSREECNSTSSGL